MFTSRNSLDTYKQHNRKIIGDISALGVQNRTTDVNIVNKRSLLIHHLNPDTDGICTIVIPIYLKHRIAIAICVEYLPDSK